MLISDGRHGVKLRLVDQFDYQYTSSPIATNMQTDMLTKLVVTTFKPINALNQMAITNPTPSDTIEITVSALNNFDKAFKNLYPHIVH